MAKRKRPTRYRAHKDFIYFTEIKGVTFENEFLRIEPNGRITVREGFLSDGCSPKYKVPLLTKWFGYVLGSPDGPRDPETGLPISARAFFLHDALLDYVRDTVNIKQIHKEFCKEIHITNWKLRKQACWMVCKLGPKR